MKGIYKIGIVVLVLLTITPALAITEIGDNIIATWVNASFFNGNGSFITGINRSNIVGQVGIDDSQNASISALQANDTNDRIYVNATFIKTANATTCDTGTQKSIWNGTAFICASDLSGVTNETVNPININGSNITSGIIPTARYLDAVNSSALLQSIYQVLGLPGILDTHNSTTSTVNGNLLNWNSTYNATYDAKPSSTFNSTYDATTSTVNGNLLNWNSTYNATYDAKPSSTFNSTYDATTSTVNGNLLNWNSTYNATYDAKPTLDKVNSSAQITESQVTNLLTDLGLKLNSSTYNGNFPNSTLANYGNNFPNNTVASKEAIWDAKTNFSINASGDNPQIYNSVTLTNGTNISLTQSGNSITISSTGVSVAAHDLNGTTHTGFLDYIRIINVLVNLANNVTGLLQDANIASAGTWNNKTTLAQVNQSANLYNINGSNITTGIIATARYLDAVNSSAQINRSQVTGQTGVDDSQNATFIPKVNATTCASGNYSIWNGSGFSCSTGGPDISYHRRIGTANDRFYTSPTTAALSSFGLTSNTLYAVPFITTKNITLDNISIRVVTRSGAASTLGRLGIYQDDGNLNPSSLVLDAGTVEVGVTSGISRYVAISQPLTENRVYWLVVASAGTPTLQGFATGSLNPILGYDSATLSTAGLGYSASFTCCASALPATFPAGATIIGSGAPAVFVRVSA